MYTTGRGGLSSFSFMAVLVLLGAGAALAQGSEMERIMRCDRDLCDIIRSPKGAGPGLQCDLSQTWHKDEIEKVAKAKGLTWVLGDAQCAMKLNIARGILTPALTDGSYQLKVPEQPASCDVEYKGTRYPVKVTVAPEITFRDGKATALTLGIHNIEANWAVKALVWSLAKTQEKLGLYQEDMVEGVNTYIEKQCRARAGKRQAERETRR